MKRSVVFLFLLLSFTFQAAAQTLEEKLAEIDAYARAVMTTHTNGAGLAPITIGTMRDQRVGAALVKQAAAVGLPITVVTIPPASAFDSLAKGDVDALLVSNIWRLRSGENADLISEVARFGRSPALAKLHVDLLATPERADRAPIYRRIEEMLIAELPTIPIAWGDSKTPYEVYLVGRSLHDFHDPITRYGRLDDLSRAWLTPRPSSR
jgi:ABC-type transport system substrate-binding protein